MIEGDEGSEIIPKYSHLPLFDSWIQKGLERGFASKINSGIKQHQHLQFGVSWFLFSDTE